MVRWNAGTEHVKTQRQEAPSQALLLGINHLRRMKTRFSGKKRLVGEQLFPSCSPTTFWFSISTDLSSHGRLCESWNHNGYCIRTTVLVGVGA